MRIRKFLRRHIVQRLPKKIEHYIEFEYYKRMMEDEVRVIQKLCDPRKISLDVGANQGDMTLFLSRFSRIVYCFEPIPELCDVLRSRFKGCNVVVECCALSDRRSRAYINVPSVNGKLEYGWSSINNDFGNKKIHGRLITRISKKEVSVAALDDYNFENLGFLKIDVEGHEMNVLGGGMRTIVGNMPNIWIEIEQRHHPNENMESVFKYIKDIGYRGYFVYKGDIMSIDEFDVSTMQDENKEIVSEYVNNFFFSIQNIF